MAAFLRGRVMFVLLLVCLIGEIGGFAALFLSLKGSSGAPKSGAATSVKTPTASASPKNQSRGCTLAQNGGYESGVVFPRWNTNAYGQSDTAWLQELLQMKAQTAACWVEMPVEFQQVSLTSTVVTSGTITPSVASFTQGIQYARSQNLHVFVTLLLHVPTGIEHWAGRVEFTTAWQEQQWFASYWQAIKPYVMAAQQAGVEQLAFGTEEQWLEDHAPASLWNTLISEVHSIFTGTLTYDVNWTALLEDPPAWLHNPLVKIVGISAYAPILDTAQRVDPQQMPVLWSQKVQTLLDTFSTKLGAPVLISEVGYRNTADAFFQPWQPKSSAATDPQEQQGACAAVLKNTLNDSHILGSFFWAWDGAGKLNLKDSPAASALHQYYQPLTSAV